MKVDAASCLARNCRSDNIAYPHDGGALVLAFANGGKRIGSFARLTYGNHAGVTFDHGVAITKFGSLSHFGRYASEVFEIVFSNGASVVGCPACSDDDSVDSGNLRCIHLQAAEFRRAFIRDEASSE